jgi:hypothetical protein
MSLKHRYLSTPYYKALSPRETDLRSHRYENLKSHEGQYSDFREIIPVHSRDINFLPMNIILVLKK